MKQKEKSAEAIPVDNNPFAVLGDNEAESIFGSSVEEMTDESEVPKDNIMADESAASTQTDEHETGKEEESIDKTIENIRAVEISYDKQYNELLESLTDHEKQDEDINMDVLEDYWNKKVSQLDNKVAEAIATIQKLETPQKSSSKPTTLSDIRARVQEDVDIHYTSKVQSFKIIMNEAISKIEMAGAKIKTETNQYWQSKLDEFTTQTNDKLITISQEMEKQRDINTDITTNLIATVQKDLNDKVESQTRILFQDMYTNMEEESKQRRTEDVALWKNMRTAMSTAYDKLVKTNSIVLKNNGLIKKKLATAKITIAK